MSETQPVEDTRYYCEDHDYADYLNQCPDCMTRDLAELFPTHQRDYPYYD